MPQGWALNPSGHAGPDPDFKKRWITIGETRSTLSGKIDYISRAFISAVQSKVLGIVLLIYAKMYSTISAYNGQFYVYFCNKKVPIVMKKSNSSCIIFLQNVQSSTGQDHTPTTSFNNHFSSIASCGEEEEEDDQEMHQKTIYYL
jgi:hypothetical protein